MRKCGFFLFLSFFLTQTSLATLTIQIESGIVHQGKNKIRVPSQSGTTIQIDELNKGIQPYIRLETSFNVLKKHALKFIYTSLGSRATGRFNADSNFNNFVFLANKETSSSYDFNSYRFGYVYSLIKRGDNEIKVGLTAKLQANGVVLTQDSTSSSYSNKGFVPLLYFSYSDKISDDCIFFADSDFIFTERRKMIDFSAKIRQYLSEDLYLSFGGRTLAKGDNTEKVYTSVWFNFVSLDIGILL